MQPSNQMRKAFTLITVLIGVLLVPLVIVLFTTSPAISQDGLPSRPIESDSEQVIRLGAWQSQSSQHASGESYLYSSGDLNEMLSLDFRGTTIEIVYVKHPSFGTFAIDIDNTIVRTVVATYEETTFDNRAIVDYLDDGQHTLRIYPVEGTIAIDAFWVDAANREELIPVLEGTWEAQWFDNVENTCTDNIQIDFASAKNTTYESEIDFNWGTSFPAGSGLTDGDTWAGMFTQWQYFGEPTTVYMSGQANAAVRIYDNYTLIFENLWTNCAGLDLFNTSYVFSPGTHQITVMYYESVGSARLRLSFSDTNNQTPLPTSTGTVTITVTTSSTPTFTPLPSDTPVPSGSPSYTPASQCPQADNHVLQFNEFLPNGVISFDINNTSSADGSILWFNFDWPVLTSGMNLHEVQLGSATSNFDDSANITIWQGGDISPPTYGASTLSTEPTWIETPTLNASTPYRLFLDFDGVGSNYLNIYAVSPNDFTGLISYGPDCLVFITPVLDLPTLTPSNTPTQGPVPTSTRTPTRTPTATPPLDDTNTPTSTPTSQVTTTPILIAPIGIQTNTTFDFQWLAPVDTYAYWVYIVNNTGVVLDQWFTNGQGNLSCVSSTCTLDLNLSYTNGNYVWYVQGYGTNGYSPWSRAGNFSINISVPNAVNKLTPSNSSTLTQADTTFTWTHQLSATWYQFHLAGVSTWYAASNICDSGICSTQRNLTNGAYTWYVQGYGPGGYGPWGSGFAFTVAVPTPATINKIAPLNASTITNPTTTFTWNHDPNATWYQFHVAGVSTWYQANTICDSGICSTQRNLTNAAYTWYVQGYGPGGYGDWGTGFAFTVAVPLPAVITKSAPTGPQSTAAPDFVWNHDPNAMWYHIWIGQGASPVYDQWQNAATICSAGTCTLNTGLTFIGNFEWYVRGWNSVGYGDWGSPTNFAYTLSLNSPTGTVNGVNLTYQWDHVSPTTTWYQIWVGTPSGTTYLQEWINTASACPTSTCSFTKTLTLPAATYNWYIQPYGTYSFGPWSTGQNFTVVGP